MGPLGPSQYCSRSSRHGSHVPARVDHAADADEVADLDLGHARPDLGHPPDDLVARHARVDRVAPVVLGLVDVRVAHAAPEDVELHVGRADVRPLELDRAEGGERVLACRSRWRGSSGSWVGGGGTSGPSPSNPRPPGRVVLPDSPRKRGGRCRPPRPEAHAAGQATVPVPPARTRRAVTFAWARPPRPPWPWPSRPPAPPRSRPSRPPPWPGRSPSSTRPCRPRSRPSSPGPT